MTGKQHREITRYVRDCAQILGLTEWTIEVDREMTELDDEALASIERPTGRHQAYIILREDFFDSAPGYRRHVVTHELTHLLLNTGEALVLDGMASVSNVGAAVAKLWLTGHEYDVDRVAAIIAPLLPLPKE